MGIEADINLAILEEIEDAGLSSVAYPNVEHDGVRPYFRVSLLPSKTEAYSVLTSNIYQGTVQIDIVPLIGSGQIVIDILISAVLAIFPRNHHLKVGSLVVRFDKAGWVSPAVTQSVGDGKEFFVPVNFTYLSISKEM